MPEVNKKLIYILGMTNEWLRFAEAKNAGLLALAGATATMMLSLIVSTDLGDGEAALYVGFILLAISVLVCLWSFLPKTDLPRLLGKAEVDVPRVEDNLYFFGHLCKYTPVGLAQTIAVTYCKEHAYNAQDNKSDLDLAAQIIINSRIATAKFGTFAVAAKLAFLGVIAAVLGILVPVAVSLTRY